MLIGLGQTSSIGAAIQNEEGFYPGSLSYQNNNPGNLIASSWAASQPGYVGSDANGFAIFDTLADGTAAMNALIQNYANNGATIQSMMAAWAPSGQGSNNPNQYAQVVANAVGASVTTPVADVLAGSAGTSGGPVGSAVPELLWVALAAALVLAVTL